MMKRLFLDRVDAFGGRAKTRLMPEYFEMVETA